MTASSGGALDVHTHAMPLPLLRRLARQGLADLDGVPDGVVELDPRVSGVGPGTPLPLARSQAGTVERDGIGGFRHLASASGAGSTGAGWSRAKVAASAVRLAA